ncbi:hypothetical protein [Nocardia goodfellowii]|uniref:Uncharacterized protein n=1 Tax=Nocardia goodfellowii TaxID=882446 RepID=A0ABS4QHE1_9NOCA|nr:hypothetical protein [Nocardia goodfellowii]MBP2191114.1 hypothetical protein [Nocardia goodfellowii]
MESIQRLQLPQLGVNENGYACRTGFGARPVDEKAAQLLVLVGGDETTRTFDPAAAYPSLRVHGIDWQSGWGQTHTDPEPLPLSLSVGEWLLHFGRPPGMLTADVEYQAVCFDATPQECATLGRDLATRAERVAMLVLVGGTALRGDATGRAAWQVLAGAAEGARLQADLLLMPEPYEVGHFVGSWTERP